MISIFKTSIASRPDLEKIKPYFATLSEVLQWTVDLYDCDRILRVSSISDKNKEIITILRSQGFSCFELATYHSAP